MGVMQVRYVYEKTVALTGSGGGSSPATTWNSADKTSNLALSNSDRTVSFTGGSNQVAGIRSVASAVSSQKVYIEHVVGTILFAVRFGFADSAATLTDGNVFGASPTHAFGLNNEDGRFVCADSPDHTAVAIAACASGDRMGIAFDSASGKAWFRKNGGGWNSVIGGAQDPAAGTGGLTIPFAGPYYAFGSIDANVGDVFTTNFASTSWTDAAPSGFTQLAA